ncbi:hypothetical protein [Nocardia sp. NPDC057227]|uniref:hypothetical protein n=1 Tax=Nocardia sp. NPDC057227 TaxID=3346056 RepID=UPI00363111FE
MPCCLLAGFLSAGFVRVSRRLRGHTAAPSAFAPTARRSGPEPVAARRAVVA